MSETTDPTADERDKVIDPWHRGARADGWDADGDVLYWAAVDGIAWALIEASMDTSDREPSQQVLMDARGTAERILLPTTTPVTPEVRDVEALVAIHAKWGARNPRSSRDLARAILASDWLGDVRQTAWNEGFEAADQHSEDTQYGDATGVPANPYGGAAVRAGTPAPTEPDAGHVETLAKLLAAHADCVVNDSRSAEWINGSGETGIDVWSCGIEVPFVEDLDDMERAHIVAALAPLLDAARRKAGADALTAAARDVFDTELPADCARYLEERAARIARESR